MKATWLTYVGIHAIAPCFRGCGRSFGRSCSADRCIFWYCHCRSGCGCGFGGRSGFYRCCYSSCCSRPCSSCWWRRAGALGDALIVSIVPYFIFSTTSTNSFMRVNQVKRRRNRVDGTKAYSKEKNKITGHWCQQVVHFLKFWYCQEDGLLME